jgi:hypothetical protein
MNEQIADFRYHVTSVFGFIDCKLLRMVANSLH